MARATTPVLFRESQRFSQVRVWVLTAILPVAVLFLAIMQVGLGHPLGKTPMSNGNLVGWSIFLWIIYLRLVTVKLVTEVGPGQVRIALRGLWRSSLIQLAKVRLVDVVEFDPRDWGGLGIRSSKRGRAYIAGGKPRSSTYVHRWEKGHHRIPDAQQACNCNSRGHSAPELAMGPRAFQKKETRKSTTTRQWSRDPRERSRPALSPGRALGIVLPATMRNVLPRCGARLPLPDFRSIIY